eukprot:1290209-Rhodomonas_salina.1
MDGVFGCGGAVCDVRRRAHVTHRRQQRILAPSCRPTRLLCGVRYCCCAHALPAYALATRCPVAYGERDGLVVSASLCSYAFPVKCPVLMRGMLLPGGPCGRGQPRIWYAILLWFCYAISGICGMVSCRECAMLRL